MLICLPFLTHSVQMDYQDLSDGAKQQLEMGVSVMSTPTSSRSNSTTNRTAAAYSSNGNGHGHVPRSSSTSSLVQQKKSGPALLRKDAGSVLLLLLLYTLQGIPMGLSGSIPLLLHDKVIKSLIYLPSDKCSISILNRDNNLTPVFVQTV
jgi:hypothetical protein